MKVTPSGFLVRSWRASAFLKWTFCLGCVFLLLLESKLARHHVVPNQAKIGAAKADIGMLSGFLVSYERTHDGKFPTSINALVEKDIITEWMSKDPWDNPYQLVVPARRSKDKFDLFSLGEKIKDESDDVGNWDE